MADWAAQEPWTVRVEWGPTGAHTLRTYAAAQGPVVAVVVDVLSFTTALSVGVEAGMTIWPYPWRDESAARFAAEHGATLAVDRSDAVPVGAGGPTVSLSPGSLAAAAGMVHRVVLPSPNGSTISAQLAATSGTTVIGAALRNRTAAAVWVIRELDRLAAESAGTDSGQPAVLVVPAGERWSDGTLRPAAEDLWGAGAFVEALARLLEHRAGPMLLAPEARLARAAWREVAGSAAGAAPDLRAELAECSSGRELGERGWGEDVTIAAQVDVSTAVPVLRDGAYVTANPAPTSGSARTPDAMSPRGE